MPNELYQALSNQQPQQNPRTQAMALMKRMGIDIPKSIESDPQALLQHVMQTGKIPQGRLGMAQQVLQRLMGRG